MSLADRETGEIDCSLSDEEAEVLASAEIVIERGLTSFYDVGDALAEINERGLHRATHRTFLDYCQERWGITDRRARQLIAAATTIDSLPVGTIVPTNEGQARALAEVPEPDRPEAMARAEATGKLTAAAIEDAAAAIAAERSPEGRPDTPPSAPSPAPEREEAPTPSPAPDPTVQETWNEIEANSAEVQQAKRMETAAKLMRRLADTRADLDQVHPDDFSGDQVRDLMAFGTEMQRFAARVKNARQSLRVIEGGA